jgi:hypothetical protein
MRWFQPLGLPFQSHMGDLKGRAWRFWRNCAIAAGGDISWKTRPGGESAMYETKERYLEIVRAEVRKLEASCHCRVVDGEEGFCPHCGEHGTYDIETKGFVDAYGNSIYYSTVSYEWRCRICDIRRCH